MMMRILFLGPHPDDLELYIGHFMHWCALQGHEVRVASMTRGERSGDLTPVVRSTYLAAKVRTAELQTSCRILGVPPPEFLGFFDGMVPVNTLAIRTMRSYLERIVPDVVVTSEPIYSFRQHHDHINTGRLVYHAVSRMQQPCAIYYFHSLWNTFYFPIAKILRPVVDQAIRAHQSQARYFIGPFTVLTTIVGKFLHGLKVAGPRHAEALRRQFVPRHDRPEAKARLQVSVKGWKKYLLLLLRRIAGFSKPLSWAQLEATPYFDGTLPPSVNPQGT